MYQWILIGQEEEKQRCSKDCSCVATAKVAGLKNDRVDGAGTRMREDKMDAMLSRK